MSQKSDVVTDVADNIDLPDVSDVTDGPRPKFNRERVEVKTKVNPKEETKEETKGIDEEEYPLAKYISHRHNLTDLIKQKIDDVQRMIKDQSYRSYNSRDFWKKKYTGGLMITIDDIERTLDSTLAGGKYRGLSFRSVLSHDEKYIQWMTERNLFKNPDSLQWRIVDLLLDQNHQCRFHNQTILKELSQYKKQQKRKFESTYESKYKKYKKN